MKTLVAALFATAFVAAPAFACGMKSAQHKTMTTAKADVKSEKAQSSYDPSAARAYDVAQADAATKEPKKR